jgi:hypothetical protein
MLSTSASTHRIATSIPPWLSRATNSAPDDRRLFLNVLYGSTRRPAASPAPYEVTLNGADGLEGPTIFSCAHLYSVDRRKITATLGRVTPERRRQIGRKIFATYRLPM